MKKWFELEDVKNGVTVEVPYDFSVAGLRTNTLTKMCIDKYEAILKIMETYEDKDMGVYIRKPGVTTCPLCLRFNHIDCVGCPVMNKTGKHYCYNTPYWDITGVSPVHEMITNLKREITFLKGILK